MLSLPPSVRVFLCTQPVDMRLAFDRLAMLAEQVLRENPYSGHLFVYVNRRADRVKVLYFHGAGYKPSPLGGIVFSNSFHRLKIRSIMPSKR